MVGGWLFANATSETHIYLDLETAAKQCYYERLATDGSAAPTSPTKLPHGKKFETLTVSELNEYVTTTQFHAIDFLCIGKVMGIQTDKGWCYIGCSKKLLQGESSFTRTVCANPNVVASLRYRVELTISDETEEAIFAAFSEMIKLTTSTLLKLGNTWFNFN